MATRARVEASRREDRGSSDAELGAGPLDEDKTGCNGRVGARRGVVDR
jgi:hypothetical protein